MTSDSTEPKLTPPEATFHTKMGETLCGVSSTDLLSARNETINTFDVSQVQIAEGAAYSLAMVIRFALGHSARDGRVCALVRDSLAGCIALCCLRHLINSGSTGIIIHTTEADEYSTELTTQLLPLRALGAEEHVWLDKGQNGQMSTIISSCHNLIFGLFDLELGEISQSSDIVGALNELQTPVHCIEAPVGIDVDTGVKTTNPLYASSTLSLGLPFQGLHSGSDYVGRHYVCDTSIPHSVFNKHTGSDEFIFSDQPVVQIFPQLEGQEQG